MTKLLEIATLLVVVSIDVVAFDRWLSISNKKATLVEKLPYKLRRNIEFLNL